MRVQGWHTRISSICRMSGLIASDASMTPSPVLPLAFRSVSFAATSPILLAVLFSCTSLSSSSSVSSSPSSPPSSSTPLPIYSDCLDAVTFLQDAIQHPPPPYLWASLPARALYRWIFSVLQSFPPHSHPSLLHVRAHTDAPDAPSRANALADRLASDARLSPLAAPPVPPPTFFMDKFTPYVYPFEFVDSRFPSLLHSLLAFRSFYDPSFVPFRTLSPILHDLHPPPPHPYVRASSAYSAVIQLYGRSSQLPTNVSLASRFGDRSPSCRFGCHTAEDPHHLFVTCPAFRDLRAEYSHSLISDVSHTLGDHPLPNPLRSHLDGLVVRLFQDDACWPLGSSLFFLGLLPPLLPRNYSESSLTPDTHRILSRVAQSCHTSAIRLAARIWGLAARHAASSSSTTLPHPPWASSQGSAFVLPSHLHHFLHS
jgi:hypothetical protein